MLQKIKSHPIAHFLVLHTYLMAFHLTLWLSTSIDLDFARRRLIQLNTNYSLFVLLILIFIYRTSHKDFFRRVKKVFFFLFFLSFFIRLMDWNILYFYGKHIDTIFWEHATYGMSSKAMAITVESVLSALLLIFITLAMTLQYKRKLFVAPEIKKPILTLIAFVLGFVALSATTLNTVLEKRKFTKRMEEIIFKQNPEAKFVESIHATLTNRGGSKEISSETLQKLRQHAGLQITSKDIPFWKESIFLDPKIKQEPQNFSNVDKPNIIFVILEGLSSHFIFNEKMAQLDFTPNLARAFENSLAFTNLYNANTPTLQGQIATLSSFLNFNITTMDNHNKVKNKFEETVENTNRTIYPFITHYTKKMGYRNINVQSLAEFADTAQIFAKQGYDRYISYKDPEFKEFVGKDGEWTWGAKDTKMFGFVVDYLKKYKGDKPLFLSFKTSDLHHPYETYMQKEGVESNLLNCIYSTDAGFGELLDYFQNSKYLDNTVIIVTADHSLFPTADHLRLRENFDSSYYDKIPLFYISKETIQNPHISEVRGSSLDIVPTLFDLLNWDEPNSFMGLSLLREREKYPLLIGKEVLNDLFTDTPKVWGEKEQKELKNFILFYTSANKLFPDL